MSVRTPRCPDCRRLIRSYPHAKAPANIQLTGRALANLYALADEFDGATEIRYTAREFIDYFAPDVTHLRRHA